MNLRDIKTLIGIFVELKKYLDSHIKEDEEFIAKLRNADLPEEEIQKIWHKLEKIHNNVREDLEKGRVLSYESEKGIKEGKISAREINKILDFSKSMDKNIYFQNPLSERRYFADLLEETKNKGYNDNILNIISERQLKLKNSGPDNRLNDIELLKYKLSQKTESYFKVKRSLFDYNRPKIDEVITVGYNKIYLEIYFDSTLSNARIQKIIEYYMSFLNLYLGYLKNKNLSRNILRISAELERKYSLLNNKSLSDIQEMLLKLLKEMFITIIKQNKDLILTPTMRYQVKITNDSSKTAYCDGLSRIDHYLLGLEIGTLIIIYLICKDFYEAIPGSLLFELISHISGIMSEIEHYEYMTSNAYHIINNAHDMKDSIDKSLAKIRAGTQKYRTFSLYNVFSHETEHAFDRNYLLRINRLRPILYHMLLESDIYQNRKNVNLGTNLISLMEFYFTCRSEAVTQYREFIVNYEHNLKDNASYSLINPIPVLGTRNLIK